ncbi:Abi family protein [Nocardia sp. NPDC004860]|uniref:Abi family protein n=1 Tax=Nocardia sp. NPDC004860 TaxID=3154557 RepID=UPI0033A9463C
MAVSVKAFKSYDEQLDILTDRGMDVGDRDAAIAQLQRLNYYRLSGYWYPFRRLSNSGKRTNDFQSGTTLSDVIALYDFDGRLRTAAFDALVPVELALRAALGHALGEIDECAHLHPESLSTRASGQIYDRWVESYKQEIDRSKEEFVTHHKERYEGTLPVWVAVEVLDWGSLTYLFDFAPNAVQERVAGEYGLSAPQLRSWMKSLNVIRNTCAHHGRLFNRTHALRPKMPPSGKFPALDQVQAVTNRTFGQLTMIQHLRQARELPVSRMLGAVIRSYPHANRAVPIGRVGVLKDWDQSPLWTT